MLSRISMKNQNIRALVKINVSELECLNKFSNFRLAHSCWFAPVQRLQYNVIFHKYEMFTPKHVRYQILYQVNVIY